MIEESSIRAHNRNWWNGKCIFVLLFSAYIERLAFGENIKLQAKKVQLILT